MEELKERLIARGTDTNDKIISRFKTAYQEINEVTKYNYVVVNDVLENAVEKVSSILISEKCRVDRIEEVFLNNNEELLHEGLIDNKELYQKIESNLKKEEKGNSDELKKFYKMLGE